MTETKAAFAERTIRSLKNVLYRYMEDYGYKYLHTLPQFISTMNSRNNRSLDMKPNHVKNSDFMSILYVNRSENAKGPNLELEKDFAFPSMLYLSGKATNRNLESF